MHIVMNTMITVSDAYDIVKVFGMPVLAALFYSPTCKVVASKQSLLLLQRGCQLVQTYTNYNQYATLV